MRRILAIIVLLFAARVSAQTECDYYKGKDRVTAGGITYNVKYIGFYKESVKALVNLENAENEMCSSENLYFRDSTALSQEDEYESISLAADKAVMYRCIRECFGDARITMLRNCRRAPLKLFFAVAPNGTTLEVAYIIHGVASTLSIPPSQFARLEKSLKSSFRWQVNDFGKQLRFLHWYYDIDFNDVPTSDELKTIEKNDDSLGSDLVPLE